MKALPDFREVTEEEAADYAADLLGDAFVTVLPQESGHYRALFEERYFTIQSGRDAPSRSQWSTLKKRMKRLNPTIFVLKEYGEQQHEGETLCYVDFGFLYS